ncbi:MAG: cyclase family protein, partial [Bradyrhizobium sp.]|nr:cyclase family protein [Bradyrhizobium sp.]
MRNAFVLCCSIALMGVIGTANAQEKTQDKPQDWTKSKWGPQDEIGAANYITPELVVKAASLVKTGKTYPLGM